MKTWMFAAWRDAQRYLCLQLILCQLSGTTLPSLVLSLSVGAWSLIELLRISLRERRALRATQALAVMALDHAYSLVLQECLSIKLGPADTPAQAIEAAINRALDKVGGEAIVGAIEVLTRGGKSRAQVLEEASARAGLAREEPLVRRAPGAWLLDTFARVLPAKVIEHVVRPSVADMQWEYIAAVAAGASRRELRRVLARNYAWMAVATVLALRDVAKALVRRAGS